MADYNVNSQEEWDDLVADIDVGFCDTVHIWGDITGGEQRGDLDLVIHSGGSLSAPSSIDNWYRLAGGRLTVRWDDSIAGQIMLHDERTTVQYVHLENWASDNVPGVAEVDRRLVEFIIDTPWNEPAHYAWIGDALAQSGAPAFSADLQSWDILDALFPDNPHLWNAGKYLIRFGRKGDASKRVEDLRKAITYLERAIKTEENHAS